MTNTTFTPSLTTMIQTSNKIAIFSDLHVGVHCNASMWHDIAIKWAEWFAQDLRSKEITEIIFCGDFFHDRDAVAVNTIHVACKILDILSEFKLHVFPGNHDCFYKEKSDVHSLAIMNGRNNVYVHSEPCAIKIGEHCNAFVCPWGTSVEQISACDVVFGHFEIQTFKMNTFKLCDHGFSIRPLLEKSPLIFSGHFHFRDERLFEIGKIVYVGNPFQMDLNDANNEKGYYIFDGDSKQYDFVSNACSPLIHKIKLSTIALQEMSINELYHKITNNIITFIIDEYIEDDDVNMLKNKLLSFKPLQINFENEIVADATGGDAKDHQFDGIDTEQAIIEFIELMNYINKASLQKYSIDIYRKYS